jgi:hypothetical protein
VGEAKGNVEKRGWRRIPRDVNVVVTLPTPGARPREIPVPEGGGLVLVATARPVSTPTLQTGGLPPGTRTVSVFLVNRRTPDPEAAYRAFAFQASLLTSLEPFVPRPLRGSSATPSRTNGTSGCRSAVSRCGEYAVGHRVPPWRQARRCVPQYARSGFHRRKWAGRAGRHLDVELGMEALGALTDGCR